MVGKEAVHPALTDEVKERVRIIRERLDTFELRLRFNGHQPIPAWLYPSVIARVPQYKRAPSPGVTDIIVSKEHAERLLDALVRDGFFARAIRLSPKTHVGRRGRYYALAVNVTDSKESFTYYEDLGWGPSMFQTFDALNRAGRPTVPGAVLLRLQPFRKVCERAARPGYLASRAKTIEAMIRSHQEARKKGEKAKPFGWWQKHRGPITPLVVPYLLDSADRDVRHEALWLATYLYGRKELVPKVTGILDGLLRKPLEEEGSARMLACQFLGEWADDGAVAVLLRALEDRYVRMYTASGPRGHMSREYRAVWLEADKALRRITGADPTPKPGDSRPDDKVRRRVLTAWRKWWQSRPK